MSWFGRDTGTDAGIDWSKDPGYDKDPARDTRPSGRSQAEIDADYAEIDENK